MKGARNKKDKRSGKTVPAVRKGTKVNAKTLINWKAIKY